MFTDYERRASRKRKNLKKVCGGEKVKMDCDEIFDINEKKVIAVGTNTFWRLIGKKETGEIHFEGGSILTFPLKSAILRKCEQKEIVNDE